MRQMNVYINMHQPYPLLRMFCTYLIESTYFRILYYFSNIYALLSKPQHQIYATIIRGGTLRERISPNVEGLLMMYESLSSSSFALALSLPLYPYILVILLFVIDIIIIFIVICICILVRDQRNLVESSGSPKNDPK